MCTKVINNSQTTSSIRGPPVFRYKLKEVSAALVYFGASYNCQETCESVLPFCFALELYRTLNNKIYNAPCDVNACFYVRRKVIRGAR